MFGEVERLSRGSLLQAQHPQVVDQGRDRDLVEKALAEAQFPANAGCIVHDQARVATVEVDERLHQCREGEYDLDHGVANRIGRRSLIECGSAGAKGEVEQLADLPVIVSSADPCFSCCDRITLIDENKGTVKMVDEAWLKKLGERRK